MDHDALIGEVSSLKARVESLESWQVKQNGSLQRLEAKIDGVNKLLLTLLGGVCTSFILLIVNLAVKA